MAISSSALLKSRNEIIVKLHVQGNHPSDLFPLDISKTSYEKYVRYPSTCQNHLLVSFSSQIPDTSQMSTRKEKEMKSEASDCARELLMRQETEGVETWTVISSEDLEDHNHTVIRQKSAITNGLFHFECL